MGIGRGWNSGLGVTTIHRTKIPELVDASKSLREGRSIQDGKALRVVGLRSAHPTASFISKTLCGAGARDCAILSASRVERSPWIREVMELIATKQYGTQKAGPFHLKWEGNAETVASDAIEELGFEDSECSQVDARVIIGKCSGFIGTFLDRWVENQRRVKGKTIFLSTEIISKIHCLAQTTRSIPANTRGNRFVMTIHQAINREFSSVIVLWPFTVPTNHIMARKWLYNAITTAKNHAIILVQYPKRNRIQAAPFI